MESSIYEIIGQTLKFWNNHPGLTPKNLLGIFGVALVVWPGAKNSPTPLKITPGRIIFTGDLPHFPGASTTSASRASNTPTN